MALLAVEAVVCHGVCPPTGVPRGPSRRQKPPGGANRPGSQAGAGGSGNVCKPPASARSLNRLFPLVLWPQSQRKLNRRLFAQCEAIAGSNLSTSTRHAGSVHPTVCRDSIPGQGKRRQRHNGAAHQAVYVTRLTLRQSAASDLGIRCGPTLVELLTPTRLASVGGMLCR